MRLTRTDSGTHRALLLQQNGQLACVAAALAWDSPPTTTLGPFVRCARGLVGSAHALTPRPP
jgi:hypothetical protein